MNKKKNIIFWISIIVLAACVGYLVYYFVGKYEKTKVYEEVKKEVVKEEPKKDIQSKVEKPKVSIPIDFDTLQAKYPDVYAWIEIPGIDGMSYPIVQSLTDDSFYLNHTIEGQEGYPGSIYTESLNSKDFTDFDTVIYGHDMEDGSMFGSLKNYHDQDFFYNHRTIKVYTPDHIFTYKIFAAVVFDDRHILNVYDFNKKESRIEYLTAIKSLADNQNIVADDIDIHDDSKLITLSTCVAGQPSCRFLIQAVLINEE